MLLASALGASAVTWGACVPAGNAPPYDAGTSVAPESSAVRPSRNVMTDVFEDDFDRPNTGPSTATKEHATIDASAHARVDAGRDAAPSEADGAAQEQEEETSNLGPNWTAARTNAWRIENGKLCVQNAHNHPVWLNRALPVNARIEFDAIPSTSDGDLKAEVWGDGKSFAKGTNYTDATSYLAILGGWHNKLQVLARLNEHGNDRKVIRIDDTADDARQRSVMKGQTYHFRIERTDGKTVRWFVDDLEYLSWTDPSPLAGEGHDHFGFNEWEAKVCFDNLKITPL